eukprot:gene13082-15084_t
MERSRRYKFTFPSSPNTPSHESYMPTIINVLYDRMTECVYPEPLRTFSTDLSPESVQVIPVLAEGRRALESINNARGLGFDDWDLDFYTSAFRDQLRRDPTDVELFDIGQSNSEHSRHWFFGGAIHLDGALQDHTLFSMVKSTLPPNSATSANSVIAFHDNSSAIYGCDAEVLVPENPTTASAMQLQRKLLHPILTAETHNFPTGVAPFAGAETGTGGRLRDVQATGRGAHTLAGICGYCVGALDIPHHPLPWETTRAHNTNTSTATSAATSNTEPFTSAKAESTDQSAPVNADSWVFPTTLASPLNILIEASNGASDYGNKYGEPVVAGFTRSFGQIVPKLVPAATTSSSCLKTTANRVEWLKPVMFTAGVGLLDDAHSIKGAPEEGMLVCKVGGPAYRIGMGGGAASSRTVSTNATTDQDNNKKTELDLDFNAVQRGDAEMENRMNRVIRSCIELGPQNPIVSIHDQGAGGNGNVLKELVDPKGARIDLTAIPSGDPTLSVLEIWGAEYQENNAFLTHSADTAASSDGPAGIDVIQRIAQRENCTVSVVGEVTGDGRIVVTAPSSIAGADNPAPTTAAAFATTSVTPAATPVDLPLSLVLGKMPQKHFHLTSPANVTVYNTPALCLPADMTVTDALHRVLQLVDVGSKRFLTNKVDRSVTGLVAQQQCVGPLHTPLADVAVLAQSHFATTGIATAVGEQPLKGLVDSSIQARMTVCEALSNLVFAPIAGLESVKASCNWMWPAKVHEKVDGSTEAGADIQRAASVNMEGARMYSACAALKDCLLQLGVGIDGGKDSLTMAAQVGEETVKCPGQVLLTCYALCTDITNVLTPDFKHPERGLILYVDLGEGYYRLGGTTLSTVYNQAGRPFQPKLSLRKSGDSIEADSAGVPDLVSASQFLAAFHCIQHCLLHKYLQAGHDRSDGGLMVTLLEMAFAGNVGIDVTLQEAWNKKSELDREGNQDAALVPILFAEECGYVLEVLPEHLDIVLSVFREKGLSIECIGKVTREKTIKVDYVCKKSSSDNHSHNEPSNNDEAISHGASADNTNISVVDSNSSYISSSSNSNSNSSEKSSIVSYSTESSYLTQSTMHTSDISSLHSHTNTNSNTNTNSSSGSNSQPSQSNPATSSANVTPTTEALTAATTNITSTDPTLHTRTILHTSMTSLRDTWESTSFALELLQCQEDCVRQERDGLKHRTGPPHILTYTPISSVVVEDDLQSGEKAEGQSDPAAPTTASTTSSIAPHHASYSNVPRGPTEPHKHLVAILRQEGTNGDREMHAAFYTAGFTPYDVNMNDLLHGDTNNNTSLLDLSHFRGIVFCGGFSYADVHGSAKGWAGVIKFNPRLMSMFTAFKERNDTFSLGVCNGCQLMALLGWVGKPVESVGSTSSAEPVAKEHSAGESSVSASSRSATASIEALQTRFIHNRSGRFESRWSAVKILPSPSVLLQGMEGSTLGVWVAHGEGRVHFPQEATLQHTHEHHLAPLRFVDDQNSITEEYPFNPSGSTHGIAGLCSEDGRHLALMPHPERSFLLWQIPYLPAEEKERLQAAPWLRLFQNAKAFCDNK